MNGRLDIVVERIPNAISIPANAVFTRRGRPTVYVAEKNAWRPQDIQIVVRNPDEVAVRGITAGTDVALVEPDAQGGAKGDSKGDAKRDDKGTTP